MTADDEGHGVMAGDDEVVAADALALTDGAPVEGEGQKAVLEENPQKPKDTSLGSFDASESLQSAEGSFSLEESRSWHLDSEEHAHSHKISPLLTGILLFNVMIGAGVFNTPAQVADCGIIQAVLWYIVFGLAGMFSLELLALVALKIKVYDFGDLGLHAFGMAGSRVIDIFTVIMCAGGMLSYLVAIGTTCESLFRTWTGDDGFFTSYRFMAIIVTWSVVFPVVLIRDFGHLGIVALFALASVFSITIFTTIDGPIVGPMPSVDMFVGDFFKASGGMAFAFTCQPAALHAFRAMEPMDIKSWHKAIVVATVAGVGLCMWTGIAGYVAFGDKVEAEILSSFSDSNIGAQIMRVLLVIHLVLYMPTEFVVCRHSFLKLFSIDVKQMPLTTYIPCTLVGLAIIFCGAMITDDFGIVLDLTGGLAGSHLAYIIPAALFIKICGNDYGYHFTVASWALFIFGYFVFISAMIGVGQTWS